VSHDPICLIGEGGAFRKKKVGLPWKWVLLDVPGGETQGNEEGDGWRERGTRPAWVSMVGKTLVVC